MKVIGNYRPMSGRTSDTSSGRRKKYRPICASIHLPDARRASVRCQLIPALQVADRISRTIIYSYGYRTAPDRCLNLSLRSRTLIPFSPGKTKQDRTRPLWRDEKTWPSPEGVTRSTYALIRERSRFLRNQRWSSIIVNIRRRDMEHVVMDGDSGIECTCQPVLHAA